MGAGGYVSTSGMTPAVGNIPALDKEVSFSMGYGGVTLEYILDFPFEVMDGQFFIGGLIGGGGAAVNISQYASLSWGDIWDNYQLPNGDDKYTQTVEMSRGFFLLDPWAGIHINLLDWLAFAGKAGYFFPIADSDWKVNDSKVFGAPDLDLDNFHFEFAVLFGG
ncbi:hypothetical protein ISS30_00725 [bacterium]|nr:hypothetical protein [FCB group bacterium]MBL7190195.1 hypothetical protein [bacterium]